MSPFYQALQHTVGIEGDFSDNKNDSGGATRWGITEAVARAYGYLGPMSELPTFVARAIYRANYWDFLLLDDVADLSVDIAFELFDTGVNCGVVFAAKSFQRALNAFNHQGDDYPDLKLDGKIGPVSVSALAAFLAMRGVEGETILLRALNALQGVRYIALAERRPKDEDFIYGWFRNRVV